MTVEMLFGLFIVIALIVIGARAGHALDKTYPPQKKSPEEVKAYQAAKRKAQEEYDNRVLGDQMKATEVKKLEEPDPEPEPEPEPIHLSPQDSHTALMTMIGKKPVIEKPTKRVRFGWLKRRILK